MPINEYNNYERLAKIYFGTLSNLSYLTSAGFGVDAIRNLHHAITTGDTTYYPIAAIELAASGLFGAAGYAIRKQLREKIELIKSFQKFEVSHEKLVGAIERVVETLEEKLREHNPASASEPVGLKKV